MLSRSLSKGSCIHVNTRICQYEALKSQKCVYIAKQLVLAKLRGQNEILKKHGLKQYDFSAIEKINSLKNVDLASLRPRLMCIEARSSEKYFGQIFSLLPASIKPESRKTFKAYDGINNIFNLAYEMLSWKVHHALIKAKLEPYLGFLHSVAKGKPSLICDFEELYRYLIDDFIIEYSRKLDSKDFAVKSEDFSTKRKGKREYLNESKTTDLVKMLNQRFQNKVNVPRIRMGESQE